MYNSLTMRTERGVIRKWSCWGTKVIDVADPFHEGEGRHSSLNTERFFCRLKTGDGITMVLDDQIAKILGILSHSCRRCSGCKLRYQNPSKAS